MTRSSPTPTFRCSRCPKAAPRPQLTGNLRVLHRSRPCREAAVGLTIEDRAVMRVGIFSDTHSNLEALTAVLGAFKQEGVDKLVCLGDTVGYGASPNECCDLVRDAVAFTILGNHDAAVAGRM